MTKLANKQYEQQHDRRITKLENRLKINDKQIAKYEKRISNLEKQIKNLKNKK